MEQLTNNEKIRYSRQMLMEGWGEQGQGKLKRSRVFIAGAGGLGSAVSTYLAIAGVGDIKICDADTIELSNLNRQILHTDIRIGTSKAVSARKALKDSNPNIQVECSSDYLSENNVEQIVGNPDIILDCLDNFKTRYLLNRYCLKHNIPFVHAGVHGMGGQVTFLHPPETPCLRCVFPEAPSIETVPVVGATPGLVGCIQALEVLKYITGVGTVLKGRLLVIDGQDMIFTPIKIERAQACPDCGDSE
jgi:molybdopterin/thiamine biosynthesis adenylyltransferase